MAVMVAHSDEDLFPFDELSDLPTLAILPQVAIVVTFPRFRRRAEVTSRSFVGFAHVLDDLTRMFVDGEW